MQKHDVQENRHREQAGYQEDLPSRQQRQVRRLVEYLLGQLLLHPVRKLVQVAVCAAARAPTRGACSSIHSSSASATGRSAASAWSSTGCSDGLLAGGPAEPACSHTLRYCSVSCCSCAVLRRIQLVR